MVKVAGRCYLADGQRGWNDLTALWP